MALATLTVAACAHSRVSSAKSSPTTAVVPVQSNTPQTPIDTTVGTPITTPQGNVVTVYAFQSPVAFGQAGTVIGAADVGVCASRTTVVTRAGGVVVKAGVSPQFFSVGFADGTLGEAMGVGAKAPAVTNRFLNPGECVRGWVSFRMPERAHPAYVLFRSLSVIRWRISVVSSGS